MGKLPFSVYEVTHGLLPLATEESADAQERALDVTIQSAVARYVLDIRHDILNQCRLWLSGVRYDGPQRKSSHHTFVNNALFPQTKDRLAFFIEDIECRLNVGAITRGRSWHLGGPDKLSAWTPTQEGVRFTHYLDLPDSNAHSQRCDMQEDGHAAQLQYRFLQTDIDGVRHAYFSTPGACEQWVAHNGSDDRFIIKKVSPSDHGPAKIAETLVDKELVSIQVFDAHDGIIATLMAERDLRGTLIGLSGSKGGSSRCGQFTHQFDWDYTPVALV